MKKNLIEPIKSIIKYVVLLFPSILADYISYAILYKVNGNKSISFIIARFIGLIIFIILAKIPSNNSVGLIYIAYYLALFIFNIFTFFIISKLFIFSENYLLYKISFDILLFLINYIVYNLIFKK